ncbi:MAG: hypothetical protein ACI8TQ_003819 [Planctomycetota bacterium]|jgi:hypothetical protein
MKNIEIDQIGLNPRPGPIDLHCLAWALFAPWDSTEGHQDAIR